MRTHLVIPDTQQVPGAPTFHLDWIGRYIVDQFKDTDLAVIHLGDHWDMPSLSGYDRGKRQMEGRRYMADIAAGNDGIERLSAPLEELNAKRKAQKEKQWHPDLHFCLGNHEQRIERAVEADAQMEGLLSYGHFNLIEHGWQVHPFLSIVDLDGVWYSHYFYNPMTGNPYAGTIDNRLQKIGHSFTMGHQQTLLHGIRYVGNKQQHGLVAGASYPWEMDYKGPQGNHHWRGIIVCHEVNDGAYDPMFVSLNFLCHKYEGASLDEYMKEAVHA